MHLMIQFIKDLISLLSYKGLKKLIIFMIGITVLLLGISLIVLPGPAFIVIPIGLAILGTEFIWAKKLLTQFKEKAKDAANSVKNTFKK